MDLSSHIKLYVCIFLRRKFRAFSKSSKTKETVSSSPVFYFLFYIRLQLINNVVVASGVQQSVSVTNIDISQFSSVAQSCPTLCNPMDSSTQHFPVYHQFLKLTQAHVHRVRDAIQPSHPLSSPSPAFNLSQHQGLSQWVSSSHQVAKVLELQLQHQSFQWIFRADLLQDGLVGSPCSPRNSQESSSTPQFKSILSLALSFLYLHISILFSNSFPI